MLKIVVVLSLLLVSGSKGKVNSRRFTALEMFTQVINDMPDDNVIICPPAIDVALVQLYLAAGGDTETELKNVLGYEGAAKEKIYKSDFPSWVSEEKPLFRIASRFYARKRVPINPSYKSMYAKLLNTDIEIVEDSDKWPEAPNKWITSQTEKDLEDLIYRNHYEVPKKVLLTSTVSFSATWRFPFKPVPDENFYIPDEGRSESVKMMELVGNLKYSFNYKTDCHVVIIPFTTPNLEMLVLIPRSFDDIQKVEEGLKLIDVRTTAMRHIGLTLPVFKFRHSRDMVQTLVDLRVNESVFTHTNLSELVKLNEKFKIDKIVHSTFVHVDAKGVKSAVATGVDAVSSKSAKAGGRRKLIPRSRMRPNVDILVNHPFLFAIMDHDRMYFFGRYSFPSGM